MGVDVNGGNSIKNPDKTFEKVSLENEIKQEIQPVEHVEIGEEINGLNSTNIPDTNEGKYFKILFAENSTHCQCDFNRSDLFFIHGFY
jgi:hypothetical protein